MTPDAALDNFAFFVGLRLMGADARRRLRLTLLRHPDVAAPPMGMADRLERLDALLERPPRARDDQDRLDLRARRASSATPRHSTRLLAGAHRRADRGRVHRTTGRPAGRGGPRPRGPGQRCEPPKLEETA